MHLDLSECETMRDLRDAAHAAAVAAAEADVLDAKMDVLDADADSEDSECDETRHKNKAAATEDGTLGGVAFIEGVLWPRFLAEDCVAGFRKRLQPLVLHLQLLQLLPLR